MDIAECALKADLAGDLPALRGATFLRNVEVLFDFSSSTAMPTPRESAKRENPHGREGFPRDAHPRVSQYFLFLVERRP